MDVKKIKNTQAWLRGLSDDELGHLYVEGLLLKAGGHFTWLDDFAMALVRQERKRRIKHR